MIKKIKYLYYAAGILIPAAALFLLSPVSEEKLTGNAPLRILSAEGRELIRHRSAQTGAHTQYISLSGYPDNLRRMVIQAEDRYFRYHPGFNPFSMVRAFIQNVHHGRTVSGASGITQQTVRIVWKNDLPRNPYLRKLTELLLAVRLDLQYSKDKILEAYMNRVPLRFNTEGFAAASRRIFLKDVRLLSDTEAAALVVLARGSYPGRDLFIKRLNYLLKQSNVESDDADSVADAVFRERPAGAAADAQGNISANAAPHFTDWMVRKFPGITGTVRTGISYNLNKLIYNIINEELSVVENKNVSNAAAVVLELREGELELRALAGSRDFDDETEGQVNGAFAVRSAGSTLKPFIYSLAMDRTGLRPWHMLSDENITFRTASAGEVYRPLNYDLNYWGRISAREALAASRNIPPVILLEKTGPGAFYEMLKKLDFSHLEAGPDYYGPGVVLGSSGVTLLDLTKAYSIFPAKGVLLPLKTGESDIYKNNKLYYGSRGRIISEDAARMITDILSDRGARRKSFGRRSFLDFPFPVASKTGTSKDYRDSWTVGYTDRYIVGVWAGNFSGESMNGVSGTHGAGRIFHQIIRLLHYSSHGAKYSPPADSVFRYPRDWKKIKFCRAKECAAGNENCPAITEFVPPADRDPPLCRDLNSNKNLMSNKSLIIEKPADGERFIINPHVPLSAQAVPLRIAGPENTVYKVKINGELKGEFQGRWKSDFPPVPGTYSLSAELSDGTEKTVIFHIMR